MAKLEPVIRMRKHALEQKQKVLAELYRQAEEYETQKNLLLTQMEQEREKMEELGVEMISYFGPYSKNVETRVSNIDIVLVRLNARIEVARDDMQSAYAEMKKLEITQERRDDEDKRKIDKKDSDEMDDIGIDGFRRKQDET